MTQLPGDHPPRARRLVPPAASIAIHAGLLIALTAVTIEVTTDRPHDRPERVTLAAPTPGTTPGPDQPDNAPPAAPPPDSAPSAPTDTNAPPTELTPEPASLTRAVSNSATRAARATIPAPEPAEPLANSITLDDNASGPRVRFADVDAAPARSVVFVVDASGAVASAFTFVREELMRSIDQLSPTQRFQVIVFPGTDGSPEIAPIGERSRRDGRGLALATPDAKRAVADWMSTFRPRGQSDPLAGLRMALEYRPDIAMLITRSIERTGPGASWGAGLEPTLAELDRLNPIDRARGIRRTAIAAIQLLDPDPTGIMPAIARAHGSGVSDYRVVPAERLIAPQEPTAQAIGASDTDAIESAASILTDLDDSGTTLRLFHGLADDGDRSAARAQAERAAGLAARVPDDARARVLRARAQSLTLDPARLERAITDLDAELLFDPDADAWRRLAIIDALTQLGRLADARQRLAELHTDAQEMGVSNATRARIITTQIALGSEPEDLDADLSREPFTDDAGFTEPFWELAVREAQVRARLRAARPDALDPLLDLLARARREGAVGWIPLLTDRVARVANEHPAVLDSAPAEARLLSAEAWSRDPATRPRAVALLEQLASSDTPVRAEALWRLGVLQRSAGQDSDAARTLQQLADDHPDHPRAPDALASAIALTNQPDALRPLLASAIERLPDRPEIDLWRLRLAELSPTAQRPSILRLITPNTRESTLARRMLNDLCDDLDPVTQPALLAESAGLLADLDDPHASRHLARAAEAQLAANDPARALQLADRAQTTTAELIACRALLALQRTPDAIARLNSLARRLEHDRSDAFWEAWTLLLESAGPSDPDAARAHIARLSLLDPELGGTPWRTRLRSLLTSLPSP